MISEALAERPLLANSYGQLGTLARDRGDLAAAEEWFCKSLEITEALSDRPTSALTYYKLGMLAQDRDDLAAAEGWYRKSLEIDKALGNRPGMALTYAQFGLLTEQRGDMGAALDWLVRCVALFDAFPHPSTGTGPRDLIRLTTTLGLPALEASWQRCTGTDLPTGIQMAVEQALRDPDKKPSA